MTDVKQSEDAASRLGRPGLDYVARGKVVRPTAEEVNTASLEDGEDTHGRREFLWNMARTVAVGGMSLTILPALVSAEEGDTPTPGASDATATGAATSKGAHRAKKEKLFGFLVDTTKCIGCTRCVDSCSTENNVPEGYLRTWVERYIYLESGEVRVDGHSHTAPFNYPEISKEDEKQITQSFFVPKLCNHCIDTPCVQVCPVNASYITPEGVVLVDSKQCIGCSYCVQACPFGTRFINPQTNAADKCTWCYHRTSKGLNPACVETCPTGARMFGDLNDPDSAISKAIASHRVDVLKSYLGTRPKTRYIGLSADVI